MCECSPVLRTYIFEMDFPRGVIAMRAPFNSRPKAANIFIVAEQFRNASKWLIISQSHPQYKPPFELDWVVVPPVCSAFALELYLKCLIRISRKPLNMGHDLEVLFGMVGKIYRKKVIRYFDDNCETTREYLERSYKESGRSLANFGFDFCLGASRDAFKTLRYVYEIGIETDTGWLGDVIMEGARKAILDKFPAWEGVRQGSPRGEPAFR